MAKLLEDHGYTTRVETYNAPAALHATFPGECSANLRAPLVNCRAIADLVPLTSLWPGLSRHPCQFFSPEAPPILIGQDGGLDPVPPLPPYRRPRAHDHRRPAGGREEHPPDGARGRVAPLSQQPGLLLRPRPLGPRARERLEGHLLRPRPGEHLLPAAASPRKRGRAGGRALLARGALQAPDPEALAAAEPGPREGPPDGRERRRRAPDAPAPPLADPRSGARDGARPLRQGRPLRLLSRRRNRCAPGGALPGLRDAAAPRARAQGSPAGPPPPPRPDRGGARRLPHPDRPRRGRARPPPRGLRLADQSVGADPAGRKTPSSSSRSRRSRSSTARTTPLPRSSRPAPPASTCRIPMRRARGSGRSTRPAASIPGRSR